MTGPGCDCGVCSTCYKRAWRARNKDKVKASKTRWSKTRNRSGDPYTLEYSKERRTRPGVKKRFKEARQTPEAKKKTSARNKVANEIRRGRMQKQPCEVCGAGRVQAHHDDYDKPLDVRWLCPRHHALLHARGNPNEE